MSGLSQSETNELLEELGFSKGATPSNQDIENRLDKLQKDDKLSKDKFNQLRARANKVIEHNKAEQDVSHLLSKPTSSAETTREQMRVNAATNPDLTFASVTSFTQKGTITAKRIDQQPVQTNHLAMEEDMILQKRFNSRLDAMHFSGSKPVIIGASATGFIAGQNIARTQAIQGNMLVRLGSNNEITEKDMAKVGIGAIEASLVNRDGLMLVIEGFSSDFSKTIKDQAVSEGFDPKYISIIPNNTATATATAEASDAPQKTSKSHLTPFHTKPNPFEEKF